jgi:hypothetical protein
MVQKYGSPRTAQLQCSRAFNRQSCPEVIGDGHVTQHYCSGLVIRHVTRHELVRFPRTYRPGRPPIISHCPLWQLLLPLLPGNTVRTVYLTLVSFMTVLPTLLLALITSFINPWERTRASFLSDNPLRNPVQDVLEYKPATQAVCVEKVDISSI